MVPIISSAPLDGEGTTFPRLYKRRGTEGVDCLSHYYPPPRTGGQRVSIRREFVRGPGGERPVRPAISSFKTTFLDAPHRLTVRWGRESPRPEAAPCRTTATSPASSSTSPGQATPSTRKCPRISSTPATASPPMTRIPSP